ncbi:unnamed protein product, partial [Closterium sp. NIES-53]
SSRAALPLPPRSPPPLCPPPLPSLSPSSLTFPCLDTFPLSPFFSSSSPSSPSSALTSPFPLIPPSSSAPLRFRRFRAGSPAPRCPRRPECSFRHPHSIPASRLISAATAAGSSSDTYSASRGASCGLSTARDAGIRSKAMRSCIRVMRSESRFQVTRVKLE